MIALVCLLFGSGLLGCRDQAREPASKRAAAANQSTPRHEPAKDAPVDKGASYRFPVPQRLVAIGDVHGDLTATRRALRLAGAIDSSDRWVGGKLVIVQTGDQLDRGDQEREIVDLFDALAKQAEAVGGRVHALNGNHETMNVQGDFRYVTQAGLRFGEVSPKSPLSMTVADSFKQRAAAFLPGGAYARLLAERKLTVVVGDTVFAHGGVLPEHVRYGLARINSEVSRWMRGESKTAPASVASDESLVWTRAYGAGEHGGACSAARRVFKELGVERMVVGHTVQKQGITSICGDSVWRIDVGLAAYYGDSPVMVLEIADGQAKVLSEQN
jgi:hypothetical protein